jgi:soluble lytic murein transglycosylase-like protein
MSFSRSISIGLVLLAAQISASAAEVAVLRNGFTIQFVRKEQIGDKTRLFTATGYMDVATEEIASYEKDETPPPAPTVPSVATVAMNQPGNQMTVPELSASANGGTSQTAALNKVDIDAAVREAGNRHKLDPDFISSVIKAESNFHPHAVSRKGAQGLMQLMPQTASKLGVTDPFDPKANIEAGTAHLSALMDMYHDDPIKALAAYNAGAHRVQQYGGVPPYRETRAYVAKIVRDFNAKKRAQMQLAAANAPAKKSVAKTAAKKIAAHTSNDVDAAPGSNEAVTVASSATASSADTSSTTKSSAKPSSATSARKTTKKKSATPRPQQTSVAKTNNPA